MRIHALPVGACTRTEGGIDLEPRRAREVIGLGYHMKRNVLFLVLAWITCASWAASIYKWVDEKGITHFSEIPPTTQKAEEIRGPADPSAEAGGKPPAKNWQEQETEFRKRQLDRQEAARKQEESEREASGRKKQCAIEKRWLQKLQGAREVYEIDEDGKRVPLDEKGRSTEIERSKKLIESYCTAR